MRLLRPRCVRPVVQAFTGEGGTIRAKRVDMSVFNDLLDCVPQVSLLQIKTQFVAHEAIQAVEFSSATPIMMGVAFTATPICHAHNNGSLCNYCHAHSDVDFVFTATPTMMGLCHTHSDGTFVFTATPTMYLDSPV